MYRFKHKIKFLPIIILASIIILIGLMLSHSCPYKFKDRTFKGGTAMGSLIALKFAIEDDQIVGYGCHMYSSGKENHIDFTGQIDCKSGNFTIKEYSIIDRTYFGTLKGKINEAKTSVVGGWTNSQGGDYTAINLIFTEKNPEKVLNTESTHYIRRRASTSGKKFKERVGGFFEGIFSGN